jgi:hypothetical protein
MKYFTHAKVAISLICFILVVSQLAGCASAAKSTAMMAEDVEVQHRHPYSVQVKVSGGHDTGALDATQISNEAFMEALVESIETSKLFAEIKEEGDADYLLHVTLLDLEQPTFGTSMKVSMEAAWVLIDRGNDETIWKKGISSQYTAGAFDAFAGVTRIRLATEGAARVNIKMGIGALSSLDL